MIEAALIQHLLDTQEISALVGREVRPHFIPQDEDLPCITVEKVTRGSVTSLSGASGTAGPTLRITAWAKEWDVAQDVAEAVFAALRSVAPRTTWSGVRVLGVEIEEGDEAAELVTPLSQVARDYRIWHRE